MSPSKARQKLRHIQQQLPELLTPFLQRDPLLPAYVYATQRKCGNPNCRCAKGQLHPGHSISFEEQGRRRCYSLTEAQRERLQPWAENYRRFRQARREFRRMLEEAQGLIAEIEEALRRSPSECVAKVKAQTR